MSLHEDLHFELVEDVRTEERRAPNAPDFEYTCVRCHDGSKGVDYMYCDTCDEPTCGDCYDAHVEEVHGAR